jgi:hypothetical protein
MSVLLPDVRDGIEKNQSAFTEIEKHVHHEASLSNAQIQSLTTRVGYKQSGIYTYIEK